MSLTIQERASQQWRSPKGCWTCKRRKIGCDKTIPSSNNCIRTKQVCDGYGIRLQWPEFGDGRRPLQEWGTYQAAANIICYRSGLYHFLNTTYLDMNYVKNDLLWRDILARHSMSRPRSLPHGFEGSLQPKEATLMTYYQEVLSRMITTVDDRLNGFRTVLLPNALWDGSISSKSLHNAILALSAFHLQGRDAALPYKLTSIRLLSSSIQAGERNPVGQFATCMMLCVGDVFDLADGSLQAHMKAAKSFNEMLLQCQDSDFLRTWLAYHEVLASFSQSHTQDANKIVPRLPHTNVEDTIIIGSLGCSTQVLDCISCINDLSRMIHRSPSGRLPLVYTSCPTRLLRTLQDLEQRPVIQEDCASGVLDSDRICKTAELYRLAGEIYLLRSVLGECSSSTVVQALVASSLHVINELDICTSPWPMFVVACEAIVDEQRNEVLDAIDRMQKERRIGNVEIMRDIVETLWKRRDLSDWDGDWRELSDINGRLPSFI